MSTLPFDNKVAVWRVLATAILPVAQKPAAATVTVARAETVPFQLSV